MKLTTQEKIILERLKKEQKIGVNKAACKIADSGIDVSGSRYLTIQFLSAELDEEFTQRILINDKTTKFPCPATSIFGQKAFEKDDLRNIYLAEACNPEEADGVIDMGWEYKHVKLTAIERIAESKLTPVKVTFIAALMAGIGLVLDNQESEQETPGSSLKETYEGYLIPENIELHEDFFRMGIPFCQPHIDYKNQDLYKTFNVLNKNDLSIRSTYTIVTQPKTAGVGDISGACYVPKGSEGENIIFDNPGYPEL